MQGKELEMVVCKVEKLQKPTDEYADRSKNAFVLKALQSRTLAQT